MVLLSWTSLESLHGDRSHWKHLIIQPSQGAEGSYWSLDVLTIIYFRSSLNKPLTLQGYQESGAVTVAYATKLVPWKKTAGFSWYFLFSLAFPGLPKWNSGKESTCQCWRCRRCRFCPWIGKIPWRRKGQPTPILLPGKVRG